MGEFLDDLLDNAPDMPAAWYGRPLGIVHYLAWVLGEISILVLGGFGGPYVAGLLHSESVVPNTILNVVANTIFLLSGIVLSLCISTLLEYGTANVGATANSDVAEYAIGVFLVLINLALFGVAVFAVYTYFTQGIHISSRLAIGALVLSIALKAGSLLLVGVIIPAVKAIPGIILGIVAREWWEKRKERQKAKVR